MIPACHIDATSHAARRDPTDDDRDDAEARETERALEARDAPYRQTRCEVPDCGSDVGVVLVMVRGVGETWACARCRGVPAEERR